MLEDKLKNNEQLYHNSDSGNITQHCHSSNSSIRKFCLKLCSNSLHHLAILFPWLIRDTKDLCGHSVHLNCDTTHKQPCSKRFPKFPPAVFKHLWNAWWNLKAEKQSLRSNSTPLNRLVDMLHTVQQSTLHIMLANSCTPLFEL